MPRSKVSTQNKAKQEKLVVTKQIPAPQIKTQSSSLGSGLVDSMVSGFGFGVGNSLAKSLFEPKISSEPTPVTKDNIFKEYLECLERNESTTNCELLLNMKS